ncbi:sugar O-acetyltransferase [Lactobacillus acetotolerans]|uniref:Sugar O-acetyltransferase n=1 Tax=Lactobacillus acetotolerans TaxID=1600 RepID=A0A5P5ZIA5_9LACO|nr:galactoside O-acetyltransferase [Lactobacillus acetotolerans DSM 20749 = JCM 3825]QFG51050.1 sugar O-acetyltransferase [Lactobacillus acetotolerans]
MRGETTLKTNSPYTDKNTIFGNDIKTKEHTGKILAKLNNSYHSPHEINSLVGQIINQKISDSTTICTPFNIDFGPRLKIGEHDYINQNCQFVDIGGITIKDNVWLAPNVTIASVNHSLNPKHRDHVFFEQVIINDDVWIGAGAIIVPGVTIGKGSVIAAGAVVTKDVAPYTLVGGVPAKEIKKIETD